MGRISHKQSIIKFISKQGIISMMVCFTFLTGCSQKVENKSTDYFELVRPEFTGKLAFETTDYVEDYWRVVGNTGFNNTVYLIADTLKAAGYVLESEATAADRLTYRIEKRPMTHQTWEPVSASLQIVGETEPLLVSESNRNMTYLNSASTPENGIQAEIIYMENLEQLENISVKDKIIYTEISARKLFDYLLENGALGIITYDNPAYLQPEKNKTSIQFRSLPHQDSTDFWGIALSYEAKEKLTAQLQKGKTEVLVNIQTKRYPSEELTIVANMKGAKNPDESLVFSAHIQEPGANDNATGVGTQLEMATLAAKLFSEDKVDLDRTLTFLWGDEIISTRRYIQENPERAKGIKWGISLDMVGENTALTGGSFLIEKMPDPSAIWTRGADKHTEWGGEVLSTEDMKPHYLNDFIISNFKAQGKFADWKVETNPFEGGSDHTPFLQADIPGLLLWHFTDQFYHTDNDRIDKVSQETLKNVGTAALVSGLELLNADAEFAEKLIKSIKQQGIERLKTEIALSKKVWEKEGKLGEQALILKIWQDWYVKAIGSVSDIVPEGNDALENSIQDAQQEFISKTNKMMKAMNKGILKWNF
jgi:hypothetical protein